MTAKTTITTNTYNLVGHHYPELSFCWSQCWSQTYQR